MAKQHHLLNDLTAIEQQLAQLLRGPHLFSTEPQSGTWSPPVDIYETQTGFVLTAEVPGVSLADLELKVVENELVLKGERPWTHNPHGENIHRLENSYGKFERSFSLSERIDADNIAAELDRGVLKVTLPKRGDVSGKQVEITTED
ncbi:MAG: Hsp20/alpha crystallin family protein [Acidobacteriota bacterium]|nr:Hsp20/alpha crystallin family protein [Acidobacteriota bacterium]